MLKLNLALALACPTILLLVHTAFSRWWPLRSNQKTALASILVATAVSLALLCSWTPRDWAAGIYVVTVLSCMGYIYFHVFNMGETARRIRILIELWKEGPVSEADLLKLYERADPVQIRLDRLVGLGQLKMQDNTYYLNGRLLLFAARGVALWRRLLGYTNEFQD